MIYINKNLLNFIFLIIIRFNNEIIYIRISRIRTNPKNISDFYRNPKNISDF